jgi:hypothetical protein
VRPISIAGATGVSILLVACTAVASPTTSPVSAEPTESSAPSASAAASPSQGAASGELLEGFAWNDILRVEVNALAVRVGPYTDLPLATAYTWDGATLTFQAIGEVTLNAGDFVSVDLGPIQIGDTTWYRVWPAEGGQLHYSTVNWDTKNNGGNPVEPGWVAASVGPDIYMTLHQAFEHDPFATGGLPPTLLVSGIGDYVSGPIEAHDLFVLSYVYVIDDQLAPCDFTVTVEPVAGGEGVVVVSKSTIGAFEEGGEGLGTGDRTPVVGEAFEPFHVRVSSGCEWSLRLEAAGHD